MYRHRPSAFAFIRCGPDLFIATSRRNGEELNPPGGKIDPGDADALDTAIREVREETGIRLRRSGAIFLCQSEHATHFLWDLPRIPVNFRQCEPGIKIAAVPLYVFRHSQYHEFNRDAIALIEKRERPAALRVLEDRTEP